jgi:PAS domain S-box-containing protein
MNRQHPLALVDGVITSGRPQVVEATEDAQLDIYGRIPSERQPLYEMSPSALVAVPLVAPEGTIGALVFAHTQAVPSRVVIEASIDYARRATIAIRAGKLTSDAQRQQQEAAQARTWTFAVLETLASAFVLLDEHWTIEYTNPAAAALFDVAKEQLEGRPIWEAVSAEIMDSPMIVACRDAGRTRQPTTVEFKQSWNGTSGWLEAQAHWLNGGLSITLRDVSQRRATEMLLKEREAEIRQAQKMEAVGRLAGGVAHDFNNLLMSIAGYTDLALKASSKGGDAVPHLQEVQRSAERAASLTRQLLMYSRKQVYQPQPVNLNAVVMDLQKTLLRLLGEDVTLLVYTEPALDTVMADPTQVEQMVMNLALNARDAMPAGGSVVIRLNEVRLNGTEEMLDRLPAGVYAEISVQDTGSGIGQDVLPHIFEPFFTTKPRGSGTGLGLSTTYGIIRQNGGSISVTTGMRQGTTFRIYLPVQRQDGRRNELSSGTGSPALRQPADERSTPTAPPRAARRGSGVILVAEDEESVRTYVGSVLRERGYTVLEARNGVEGMAQVRRSEAPVDLLVADVVMPGMGGPELSRRLREMSPEIAVIFMSGYAENEVVYEGQLDPGVTLLEKPFGPEILLQQVHDALVTTRAHSHVP